MHHFSFDVSAALGQGRGMESFDITFVGKLEYAYDYKWPRLDIIQADGYRIDLFSRFREVLNSFGGKGVSCSYFTSSTPLTEEEAISQLVKKLAGVLELYQDASGYAYSEYTTGTDYTQELRVGNHDLFEELRPHDGKYIVFRIHVLPSDK